jgi:hypothetical protein
MSSELGVLFRAGDASLGYGDAASLAQWKDGTGPVDFAQDLTASARSG